MNILLTPIGSYGDVHPFIGIGTALVQRGHEVTLISHSHFEPLCRQVGLKFVASGPVSHEPDASIDISHGKQSFAADMATVLSHVQELYKIIEHLNRPGQTLLVGHTLALATRVAQEKLGIPLISVHLAPWVFRSVHDPVRPSTGLNLGWLPRWGQRWFWQEMDRRFVDPVICPTLNHWRWELGLDPVRRPMKKWIHSPQGVLGLWPDWFASPQPDWPVQVELTGFSMFDQSGVMAVEPALREFLAKGDPPIVFKAGSLMAQGNVFFRHAAQACLALNRRGVFLTRHRHQLPEHLPEHIFHSDYVPLSQLLPHACAFVHDGGIGSCAHGLASGTPQLVLPQRRDQPDNAARLAGLGVGQWLKPSRVNSARLEETLGRLIDKPHIWARCKALSMKIQPSSGRVRACDAIEAIAQRVNLL